MRSLISTACLLLLVTACTPAPAPSASPTAPSPTAPSPTASLGGNVWEEFHSDDLSFSLQLPRGWTARRVGPSEGIVLRAQGGADGAMVLTIETEGVDVPFQEMVNNFFKGIIAENPNAVEAVELPGGRAARATSPTPTGGVSVIYLFAPQGNHAKSLSFTWDEPEPNPLWRTIAERFNAYTPRPIVPFITPSPATE